MLLTTFPGAARAHLLARHVHDRHRRLGRDALHAAPDVAIEHQVADDEDADPGEAPDEIREASAAHGHGRSS
jgi:hypothetical protein